MSAMVTLYVRKIREGSMDISDVPVRWRETVQEVLSHDPT